MITQKSFILVFVGLFAATLVYVAPAHAGNDATAVPESQSTSVEAVQDDVDEDVAEEANARREKVLRDAETALEETRSALQALEDNDTEKALEALERATGKLALIVARDPELALAPAGVSVRTYDLFAKPETVEQSIEQAEEHLEAGRIQDARLLLDKLASEVVISVSHIPLATYPDAIKAVAPMIDKGETEQAKRMLSTALSTMVVIDNVHPLPLLRAEKLLQEAETLAENPERTGEENAQLANYLDDARKQVEMAELLGYGESDTFNQFYEQIEEIENKTKGSSSGTDFFDAIKLTVEEWRNSLLDH